MGTYDYEKEKFEEKSFNFIYGCALRDAVLEKYIGRVLPVLFEEQKDGICYGHTASFIEVALPHPRSLHGQTVNVRLLSNSNGVMLAELV